MANNTSPLSVNETGRQITKGDIISDAFSQLRISGITVEPSVSDLELALTRLEDMAAEWQSGNISVGYNFQQLPDPNDVSGIIPAYKLAFARNLAVALIPDFNKQVPQNLYMLANASYARMLGQSQLAALQQVQYPDRMPRGSGNTIRFNRWARFYRQTPNALDSTNSYRMFIGDVQDYTINFDSELAENEYIDSYDIQVETGLIVSDESLDGDLNSLTVRIEAQDASPNTNRQLTLIVTTNLGRTITRRIFISVLPRE